MSQEKNRHEAFLETSTLHFLALEDILESSGERGSPWHRSTVERTNDEQRGKAL